MATLTVSDETATGASIHEWAIPDVPDLLPVRDIIRLRVRDEVARSQLSGGDRYQGLVRPTPFEATVNGPTTRRPIDWERQADKAILAFQRNGFFLLIDDRQVTSLDELIDLRRGDRVTFIRLVPLAGG